MILGMCGKQVAHLTRIQHVARRSLLTTPADSPLQPLSEPGDGIAVIPAGLRKSESGHHQRVNLRSKLTVVKVCPPFMFVYAFFTDWILVVNMDGRGQRDSL